MTTTNTSAPTAREINVAGDPPSNTVTVTKLSAGRARGVNAKTAPQTVTKVTRGQKAMGMTNAPKKGKPVDAERAQNKDGSLKKTGMTERSKAAARRVLDKKAPAKVKATSGATFTTVDLAAEQGINAKTLRARIRRNIDRWAPLFVNGEKHTFADNATTRKAVAALLAD